MDTDNLSLDDLEKLAGNPDLLFDRRLVDETDVGNVARDAGLIVAPSAAGGYNPEGWSHGGGTAKYSHQGRAFDYRNDKSLQDSLPDLLDDTLQETVPDFWARAGNPDNSFAVRAQSQASHTLSFAELAPLVGHDGCIANMHSSLKSWMRPGTCACAFGDSGRRLGGHEWPTQDEVVRNIAKAAAWARAAQKPNATDMIRKYGQKIGYKNASGNEVKDDGSPFNAEYFLAPVELKKTAQNKSDDDAWKDDMKSYHLLSKSRRLDVDGLSEVRSVIKNTIFGTLDGDSKDTYVEKAGKLEDYFEKNIGNVMDQRKMACWCPKIEIKDWNEEPEGTVFEPPPTYKPRCPRPTRRLLDYMIANPSKIMVDIHHYEEV